MKPYAFLFLLFVLISGVLLSRPHMICAGPNAWAPSLALPAKIQAGIGPTRLSELTTASSSSTLPPADSIAADSTTDNTNRIPRFSDCQPVRITHIQMFSEKTGWAISSNYGVDHILCTGDGGASWQDVTPPEQYPGSSEGGKSSIAFFLNEDLAWITYNGHGNLEGGNEVWHTTDRGQSWESNQPLDTAGSAKCLHFIDPQTGWLLLRLDAAMGSVWLMLYRTTDGGANWERLFHPYEVWPGGETRMIFIDSAVGISTITHSAVNEPIVTWTKDGGKTWVGGRLSPPESNPDLFQKSLDHDAEPILFSPKSAVFGVSCWSLPTRNYERTPESSFLYTTDDGGVSWYSHPYPGGKVIFLNPDVGWAVRNYIFHTRDGGLTWSWIATVGWDGQFSFVNEQVGWAVARWQCSESRSQFVDSLALMHTTDGGHNWKQMEPRITGKCPSEK